MARLVKVATTKDLPPGTAAAFDVEGQTIAVFNVGGAYYAIDDTCPHGNAPLSQGKVQGTRVICPWHWAEFDLRTGAVLAPPAFEDVRTYKVVVEGDAVMVEIE